MKKIIKNFKFTKTKIIILVITILCIVLLMKILKPYFIYKSNENELKTILSEITEVNRLKVFKDTPYRYYDGYDAVNSSEISSELSSNIDKLFEDKNITYIGWGCPINGFYCWNQLYVKIADYGRKEKYLMYCEDGKFSGILRFSLYDHFGLDQPDVEKIYVNLAGFRAWFVLQHYNLYNGKYEPFINLMEYEVSFSGKL